MKYNDYLQGYEQYLQERFKDPTSPHKYARRVTKFLEWVESQQLDKVQYADLMEFIRHSRQRQLSAKHINAYLRAIRHFFDYLQSIKNDFLNPIQGYNPAENVQIKDTFHSLHADYLSSEELEELIMKYEGKHRILLGLLVYQGLKISEIEKLEKIHFDLKKGTVYIPQSIRNRSRVLKLEANQLYELITHLGQHKGDAILGKPLHNQGRKLCKDLRQINAKVRNPHQMRASRIAYWLRQYDIREVQYLAGHRTIAGIEKYQKINMEDLANQLNKYHPHGDQSLA
jgi:integrase/recombinase XerD